MEDAMSPQPPKPDSPPAPPGDVPGEAGSGPLLMGAEPAPLTEEVVRNALRAVVDPELGINIVDLGLVYGVDIDRERGHVKVTMTLTAIGCPLAFVVHQMVENALLQLDGVQSVQVEIVWDPPWTPERMSEEAKALLGFW
ncbi:MAG TPA: metal-sulfur cluster assembly factor [Limnochordales bacterium]